MSLQRKRLIARKRVLYSTMLAMSLQRKRLIARKRVLYSTMLAILLQRKHPTIIVHSRVFVVFCKTMLTMSLQRKRLIARKRGEQNLHDRQMADCSQACFAKPCLQCRGKENV